MVRDVWDKIILIAQNEPVLRNLIVSGAMFLTSFGIDISNSQVESVVRFVFAAAAIIVLASTRQEVTPVRKVDEKIEKAIGTAVPLTVAENKIDEAYNAIPGVDEKPTLEKPDATG